MLALEDRDSDARQSRRFLRRLTDVIANGILVISGRRGALLSQSKAVAEPVKGSGKRTMRRFEPMGWLLLRAFGHLCVLWNGLISSVTGALRFHSLVFRRAVSNLAQDTCPIAMLC